MLELLLNIVLILLILMTLCYYLGRFINSTFIDVDINPAKINKFIKIISSIENMIFKFAKIDPLAQMSAKSYYGLLLLTNLLISVVGFFMLYFQKKLPLHSTLIEDLSLSQIFHTITSYITNTDQMHFAPETNLTFFSNYITLPIIMLVSSATAVSVGIMFIRAITKNQIGNFYRDYLLSFTRILLPICFLLSIIHCAIGLPNTFKESIDYTTLENVKQTLLLGPIAAIQPIITFGTNGGGVFNANAAHPLANPTYLSNLIQIILMLAIPTALIFTLGFSLKNLKQSIVILAAIFGIIIVEIIISSILELRGNTYLNELSNNNAFPNWPGKETRFGIIGSVIYSISATSTCGATNSSLDFYHPASIAFMLVQMLNGPLYGNMGVGPIYAINYFLYTMIFIGFMLGKTPEIFGKKIEKNEIILSSLLLLIGPFLILVGTAITIKLFPINSSVLADNLHHYTRIFYEYTSASGNNGSGLEGLMDNTTFSNIALGLVMTIGWYGPIGIMMLLASGLSNKHIATTSETAFKTDTISFSFIYLIMLMVLTLLVYLPFLILGPGIEALIK